MNLQSSTLLSEDTGVPFDQLQAEQIMLYARILGTIAGHIAPAIGWTSAGAAATA